MRQDSASLRSDKLKDKKKTHFLYKLMGRSDLVVRVTVLAFILLNVLACQKNEGIQVLREGSQVPAFTLKTVDDTGNWSLEHEKGSVVIINFWASWCSSCIEEMPSMQRFYKEFMGKNVKLITILYKDNPFQAVSFMNDRQYNFPVMRDHDLRIARLFGVTGVPETYIISKEAILLNRIIGPFDWDSSDFRQYISEILK